MRRLTPAAAAGFEFDSAGLFPLVPEGAMSQKTFVAKKETVEPQWFLVDADGETVGRLATRLATVLMGKHKPIYTPHVDCGDFIVVVNAEKVRFTGKPVADAKHPNMTTKFHLRTYEKYSFYAGGRKVRTAAEMLSRKPEFFLQEAVRRMLPKNKLGRHMLDKLKLYAGTSHPHQAQQPQPMPEQYLN
jgi:large subunit ribosomal protein L13